MTEKEAWSRWHREERIRAEFRRKIRELELTVEGIQLDMAQTQARIKEEIRAKAEEEARKSLPGDKAFIRTCGRLFALNERAWIGACRCDGRLRRLPDKIGWAALASIIREVRDR